ncbi:MAG: NADH-quinone oxidoreductase subunit J [Candidatus Azobacteroides sp.]|nr:NADH-quinone oxidoreductase subunit J [Candidatus Azobacteroides sp.]
MEITVSQVIFGILAVIIVAFSILTVTTRRILRSATFLLFVLLATAGVYFLLDYHFLAAVQITVYAGGILVLFVFSIFLTSHAGDKLPKASLKKMIAGLMAAITGGAVCLFVILKNGLRVTEAVTGGEIDMKQIGYALMGTGKYQYLLPFEAVSILLLACIIGGILIARKR